jgi:hypothetical protein
VYATSVVMVGMVGAVSIPPPGGDFFFGVALFGFAAMPVAVGVAVLRYNLYDIDVVINRTLVYGSLTVLLAAIYYGSVAGFRDCSEPSPDSRAPWRSLPRPWR